MCIFGGGGSSSPPVPAPIQMPSPPVVQNTREVIQQQIPAQPPSPEPTAQSLGRPERVGSTPQSEEAARVMKAASGPRKLRIDLNIPSAPGGSLMNGLSIPR